MQNIKAKSVLALLLTAAAAAAQEAPTAAGGDATGTGGKVAYSVGQVSYIANTGSNGNESQGVQQVYQVETTSVSDPRYDITLAAYPNPAGNLLNLLVKGAGEADLSYSLHEAQGKLVGSKKISAPETQIDLGTCAAGAYMLTVTRQNTVIRTFRIIKK